MYIAFLPTFMDLNALSGGDIVLACVLTLAALMAGLMSIDIQPFNLAVPPASSIVS